MTNDELINQIINGNKQTVSRVLKAMPKTLRFYFLVDLKASGAVSENELWLWIQKVVEVNL